MKQYSWVDAIKRVMEDNGGAASLPVLYRDIGKYRDYTYYSRDRDWQAALRGHLYREISKGRNFKRIGLSIYALADYKEAAPPPAHEKRRMHSFVEGICIELGNFERFATYTADPSAIFRDNITLGDLATIKQLPQFTYPEIVAQAKRIDVVWFNARGLLFPQRAFEVVDSLGTLGDALHRSAQLMAFNVKFVLLGPKEHRDRFRERMALEPYVGVQERYQFRDYDEIMAYYEQAAKYYTLKARFL